MRLNRYAILLALLGGTILPAFGIDVTSCNTILDEPSGSYILKSSLTTAAGCIIISADNVTFDMDGYEITYSQTAEGSGILVQGSNAIIKNGTITKGNFNAQNWPGSHAIRLDDTDAEVDGITFNIVNNSSDYWVGAIEGTGSGNINVHNCKAYFDGGPGATGFIQLDGGSITGDIHSNLIHWYSTSAATAIGTRPYAISIKNSQPLTGRLRVWGNTIEQMSSNNDLTQGVLTYRVSNIDVYDNTLIGYGTSGRMINFDYGWDSTVHHNTLTMNHTGGWAIGLRVRYSLSTNNEIYNNTVDASGSTGSKTWCAYYGSENSASFNNDFHHNTLTGGQYQVAWRM